MHANILNTDKRKSDDITLAVCAESYSMDCSFNIRFKQQKVMFITLYPRGLGMVSPLKAGLNTTAGHKSHFPLTIIKSTAFLTECVYRVNQTSLSTVQCF